MGDGIYDGQWVKVVRCPESRFGHRWQEDTKLDELRCAHCGQFWLWRDALERQLASAT